MKTVSRSNGSLFSALVVVGGLVALYFYRKNGGSVRPLLERGVDLARTAGEKINSIAPSVSGSITGRAQEIATAPEQMDQFATT